MVFAVKVEARDGDRTAEGKVIFISKCRGLVKKENGTAFKK